jgi:hypothetical protein
MDTGPAGWIHGRLDDKADLWPGICREAAGRNDDLHIRSQWWHMGHHQRIRPTSSSGDVHTEYASSVWLRGSDKRDGRLLVAAELSVCRWLRH